MSWNRLLGKVGPWAILWAAVGLGLIFAAAFFLFNWRTAAVDAGRYRAASVCGGEATSDCRQNRWITIIEVLTQGNQTTHINYEVQLPSGEIIDLMDHEDSGIYKDVNAGTQVLAEFWRDEVVTLQSAGGKIMKTQYHPDWKTQDNLTSGISFGFAGLVFGYLSYVAARRRME